MDVPREHRAECERCGGDIIRGRTTRKSKGEYVLQTVDADEDTDGSDPGLQWVLTVVGGVYHAGQPATRNQREGMMAAGYRFHLEHNKTCARRYAQGKRPRRK